jgi:hypothetical protein
MHCLHGTVALLHRVLHNLDIGYVGFIINTYAGA